MKNHFGEHFLAWRRIAILMSKNGLNAKEIAEIAGVVPSAVHKWKRGGAIGSEKIHRLAVHFGVPVDWFFQLNHGLPHPCGEPANGPDLTSPHPCSEVKIKPGSTSFPPLNEAPKPAAVLHLDAGESSPPYGQPPDCRIPAGCDVAGEVAAMKARLQQLDADMSGVDQRLDHISTQLSTLLALLGGAMKTGLRSGDGADREKKAG
jgi:hypothetical protein